MRNIYKILVRIFKKKERPLGRHRPRLEDNVKIYVKEIRFEGVDWVPHALDGVVWQAVLNVVIYLFVVQKRQGISWPFE